MANTFLAALGVDVGKSLRDDDLDPAHADSRYRQAAQGVELHLPTDAVVASVVRRRRPSRASSRSTDVGDAMILDIGPETAHALRRDDRAAKTIVFNGPMGVYEKPAYRGGTQVVGEAIARATAAGAVSVVGGGDAAAAAHMLGFADAMTHVSTGGGATLEFLEGKTLPGVAALESRTCMRTIVAGNWKMHKTAAQTRRVLRRLLAARAARLPPEVEIVVAPPFTALAAASRRVAGTRVRLGAQTMHWELDRARSPARSARRCCSNSACATSFSATPNAARTAAKPIAPSTSKCTPRSRRASRRSSPSAKPLKSARPAQTDERVVAQTRAAFDGCRARRSRARRDRVRTDLGDRHRHAAATRTKPTA